MDWAVPWTKAEAIDTVFLVVTCLVVTSVPLVYLFRANLRDPFARAILAGTGVTAAAFNTSLVVTLAIHMGWQPTQGFMHGLVRAIYVAVAVGKGLFLVALIGAVRLTERRRKRRFNSE